MTVHEMRNHPAFDVLSVKSDLDKIKTGMAETGSSISKLENTHETMEKQVKILSQRSAKFHMILLNVTVRFIFFFFIFLLSKIYKTPRKVLLILIPWIPNRLSMTPLSSEFGLKRDFTLSYLEFHLRDFSRKKN